MGVNSVSIACKDYANSLKKCEFHEIAIILSHPEMDSTLGDTQFAVLGMCMCINTYLSFLSWKLSPSLPLSDHENAILYRLQDVILEQTSALLDLVELTAELDW